MPARNRASKNVVKMVESEENTEEDEVLAELEDEDEDYVADEDADEPDSEPDSKVRLSGTAFKFEIIVVMIWWRL